MTGTLLVGLAIKLSMALIVLGIGLSASFMDATWLFRRPRLLLRSLISMNVAMPLFAAAVVPVFDLNLAVQVALIALALSPVPPILPTRQIQAGGARTYTIGLLVAASVCAIVIVPLGVGLIGLVAHKNLHVPMSSIAAVVVVSILVPLAGGLLIRRILPEFAEWAASRVSAAGNILLVAAFVAGVVQNWPAMVAVLGNGTIVALIAFSSVGLAIGHSFGGPAPDERTVLALATAARHPGVAVAIAAATHSDVNAVLAVVLWHLIIGTIVSVPYASWRRQVHDHAGTRGEIFAKPQRR